MRLLPVLLVLLAACSLPDSRAERKQRALDSADAASANKPIPEAVATLPPTYVDSNVTWPQMQEIVRANPDSILAVYQTHARAVSVAMRNGRRYRAQEPVIDAIIHLLRQVDPAGRILIATE